MDYQDRLETKSLQLFEHTEYPENGFI